MDFCVIIHIQFFFILVSPNLIYLTSFGFWLLMWGCRCVFHRGFLSLQKSSYSKQQQKKTHSLKDFIAIPLGNYQRMGSLLFRRSPHFQVNSTRIISQHRDFSLFSPFLFHWLQTKGRSCFNTNCSLARFSFLFRTAVVFNLIRYRFER